MVKYHDAMVVFEEIPNEITLAINITNCPCKCPGCHSKFLWNDIGTELTMEELEKLLNENDGVTCVCFMGGDATPQEICDLAEKTKKAHEKLKVGWYSGRDEYYKNINFSWFDYIKIGHYDDELGALNKTTTNQRLYKLTHTNLGGGTKEIEFKDITSMFWRKAAR